MKSTLRRDRARPCPNSQADSHMGCPYDNLVLDRQTVSSRQILLARPFRIAGFSDPWMPEVEDARERLTQLKGRGETS